MLRTSLAVVVFASLTGVAIAGDAPATPTTPPPSTPSTPAPATPAGEWTGALPAPPPEPAPQPPATTPAPSNPPSATPDLLHAPPPKPTVMDRRWSIGAMLGWESVTIKHGEEPKVSFGMLELSGRFRIRPAIEVALVLMGGGTAGDISLGGLYASFRYRFLAEERWNVYASAGLGVMAAAEKMATDDQKQGRGAIRLGVGGERRFGAFAVDAELHIVGIGENTKAPEPMMPSTAGELSRYGLSGGSFMIGVTYYF